MIDIVTFEGADPGPNLLVLGAIHGNEVCGPKAMARLIAEFETGERTLARGRLTLIPVCNPRAHERGTRFIDADLNRVFLPKNEPGTYEDRLVAEIAAQMRQADAILDIHSAHCATAPFSFLDYTDQPTVDFTLSLGLAHVVTGWVDAYRETPDLNAGDTQRLAHLYNVPCALIECGQHEDETARHVAYDAILRAARYMTLLEGAQGPAPVPDIVQMRKVYRRAPGAHLVEDFANFTPVREGQVLARTETGEPLITAPFDGFMILPKREAAAGKEWFYLGEAASDIDALIRAA